ncbi:MAG: chloride channel protein [Bdellovibrionales bacterium]|nr:chloride channel protein [Bdellovibrionales bacterium]
MQIKIDTKDIYEEGTKKIFEIKQQVEKLLPFWIAGSITALVATSYAHLFSLAEDLSKKLYHNTGLWFLFVPPIFFFISWFFVDRLAPKSNGSGIPQLMASIELSHKNQPELIDSFLNFRIILIKIISSLLGVLGGGSMGREGPTLQISGSIFHLISRHWHWSEIENKSAFLMAGAASGLASAFNTPLGGIVYVIEELAKSHLSTFRTGVLHAVIFAGIISQMIMGPYLYFGYPKVPSFKINFIWKYLIISLFSALIVTGFSQCLKLIVKWRSQLDSIAKKSLFALLAGLYFALVVVFLSSKGLGPGKDLLNSLLFDSTNTQVSDVCSRFIGSLMTYANGGAGGIFAPTLSLGGSFGSLINHWFNFDMGTLPVLIGMTAGLSALTHSPLTSFILVLEMTDRHRSIFPIMLAAIIGHGVSKIISNQSFYDFVAHRFLEEIK